MIDEKARGMDSVAIKNTHVVSDGIKESAVWKIRRWASEEDKKNNVVYSKEKALKLFGREQFSTIIGNALVNQGMNEMWTVLCSAGGNEWDNTNAVLIVGTGSGAENPADVEGSFTAGVKKAMDGGYPTYGTSQKAVWRATYGSAEANQVWAEFGVLNNTTAGDLMNRKVSAQGTKTAGQTWELTLEITLS